jgi:hypothetical protein
MGLPGNPGSRRPAFGFSHRQIISLPDGRFASVSLRAWSGSGLACDRDRDLVCD